jgi:hypothetical protein
MPDQGSPLTAWITRTPVPYFTYLISIGLFLVANGGDRLTSRLDPLFLALGVLLLAFSAWLTVIGKQAPPVEAVTRCRFALASSAWSLAAHMALFYYVAHHKHQVIGSRFILLGLGLLAATVMQSAAVASWLRSYRMALSGTGEKLLQGSCIATGAGLALTAFLKGGAIVFLGSVLSFLLFFVNLILKPFLPH